MGRQHKRDSIHMSIGMTGTQVPTSPAPDTIHRLEVESSSSTSLPTSVPYYNYSDHNSSLDTVSLLRGQPRYTNTSHLNVGTPPPNRPGKPLVAAKPEFSRNDDSFNQVPKRFSQFILDQQNPYVAQRLDNLSLNLLSVSEHLKGPRKRLTYSRASRQTRTGNGSAGAAGAGAVTGTGTARQSVDTGFALAGGHSALGRSSTNISESMGSQATIFSTRDQLVNRRVTRRRMRNLLYAPASEASTLSRQNAVRVKQGGWWYRVRLRMAKLARKLRFRFFASSKRTGSIKRHGKRKPSITHANRSLGAPTERVPFLDDNLKLMAGAYPAHIRLRSPKKQIQQQMQPQLQPQPVPYAPGAPAAAGLQPSRQSLKSSVGSTPPPVPPHLVRRSMTAPLFDDTNDTIELWRQYLTHVVCRRVLLRQEIGQFQSYLAAGDPLLNRLVAMRTRMPRASFNAVVKETGSETDYETISESSSVADAVTSASEALADTDFSHKVLNRRSMLGQMLDYQSDDLGLETSEGGFLDAGSHRTDDTKGSKVTSSELAIIDRYGTVRRHKAGREANSTPSVASGPIGPSLRGGLPRSPGVPMDLALHA